MKKRKEKEKMEKQHLAIEACYSRHTDNIKKGNTISISALQQLPGIHFVFANK